METIKILHSGIFHTGSPFHWNCVTELNAVTKPHIHDFYEVFVITVGQIFHNANGREKLLEVGDIALIRPSDRHCYRRVNSQACRFINLAFTPAVAYDAFRYLDHNFQQQLDCLDYPMEARVEISQAIEFDKVVNLASALPDEAAGLRNHRLKLALFGLMAAFLRKEPENSDGMPLWLKELAERMQTAERFTAGLPALYEMSSYTPEHLSRSFRRYLKTTPTGYVNSLRLNYIRNMLETTDISVTEILSMAGFNNISHGNHLFRSIYGASPSEHRQRYKKVIVP